MEAVLFPAEAQMADYFTQFSCILDVGSPENARRAVDLYQTLADDLDHDDESQIGFLIDIITDGGGSQLWIHDGGSGEPEHVIQFVRRCAETFGLSGRWGFEWANTNGLHV
ncbi:MAG: hypothetical protein LCH61_11875 [Proteobacteria bacterium]|nr:hypothetical protein [Pseudomonadota bacterium]